jgi:hypothetical protein
MAARARQAATGASQNVCGLAHGEEVSPRLLEQLPGEGRAVHRVFHKLAKSTAGQGDQTLIAGRMNYDHVSTNTVLSRKLAGPIVHSAIGCAP